MTKAEHIAARKNSLAIKARCSNCLTSFGRAIRTRRLELGLSLQALADKMEISTVQLLQVELHQGDICLSTLLKFSRALKSDVATLAGVK